GRPRRGHRTGGGRMEDQRIRDAGAQNRGRDKGSLRRGLGFRAGGPPGRADPYPQLADGKGGSAVRGFRPDKRHGLTEPGRDRTALRAVDADSRVVVKGTAIDAKRLPVAMDLKAELP